MFLYLIEGENRHCSYFFAVKADLFLIFPFSEAGHVLNLFLFFERFEPQRSYKRGFHISPSENVRIMFTPVIDMSL